MFAASKTDGASDGGYQISRSLRFNSADSTYLVRTPSSNGSQTTSTASLWVKRSVIGAEHRLIAFDQGGSGTIFWLFFNTSDQLQIYISGTATGLTTTQVFRDPSAWYHIVVGIDTTQATSSNRIKLYVNGSQITAFTGTQTYYSLNATIQFNNTGWPGQIGYSNSNTLSGYMTEFNWIDGTQLTPSSFGETNAQTGVWQPKAYSGSYGTNGFYLNFSDNSNTTAATLGKDYSGNGNNWTPNNFSVTAGAGNDSLVDSPTSYGTDTGVGGTVRGNYATLNAVFVPTTSAVTNPTLANGNLSFVGNVTTDTSGRSTIGVTSGKWYCEVTVSYVSALQDGLGIAYTQSDSSRVYGVLYRASGDKCVNNTVTSYGTNYAAGSVIGIALDADANTVTFYNSNNSQGSISFTPTTAIYFSTYGTNASPAFAGDINFGQRPFAYTAPSGYKALCTQNLPTPTIGATTATQAGKYFNPVLYTGNSSTNAITGVGFQPDLTWFKRRDAAFSNVLQNAVTGVTKYLVSNTTDAEGTYSGYIQSWNSDGFTLGTGDNASNNSGSTYVAWNWKANGSGSTNTNGSVTSTVSANTTSGFSVVTWTGSSAGQTVGHGLGVAPSLIITKTRSATGENWPVYHKDLGIGSILFLNTTGSVNTTYPTYWGSSAPTSTVFGTFTGGYPAGNNNGNMVAYCFAEVAGYSKFGSYNGTGTSDGPFVYCGFKPAYVMVKCSSNAGQSWVVDDGVRNTYNVVDNALFPNLSNAENSGTYAFDFTSNGFKVRTTATDTNNSGYTYIFMAFASVPLKFSLAR